jgi:hypothetical protein
MDRPWRNLCEVFAIGTLQEEEGRGKKYTHAKAGAVVFIGKSHTY